MSANFLTKKLDSSTQTSTINRVVSKIASNPHLGPLVLELDAGKQYPTPALEYLRAPSLPLAYSDDSLSYLLDIDVARIEGICSTNNFTIEEEASPTTPSSELTRPSALYLLPSLFNHSCSGATPLNQSPAQVCCLSQWINSLSSHLRSV
jgi:hypothetical protein